jgi:DNA-binding response OmpR family regulator
MMSNKKIFVCDDDEGIIGLLGIILEDSGHEIILETNSLNARRIIEDENPDLIIVDLWMPVLSGDQIVRMVRTNPKHKHIPIIVISASRDGNEISMGSGATAFIPKPFELDRFVEQVNMLID